MVLPRSQARVYELSVAGTLGPVLSSALRRGQVATVEPCTVIRLRSCDDRDLVTLVERLVRAGVPVPIVVRRVDLYD